MPPKASTGAASTAGSGPNGNAADGPKDRVKDVQARVGEVKAVLKENIRMQTQPQSFNPPLIIANTTRVLNDHCCSADRIGNCSW